MLRQLRHNTFATPFLFGIPTQIQYKTYTVWGVALFIVSPVFYLSLKSFLNYLSLSLNES
jgi:hypothetical protein